MASGFPCLDKNIRDIVTLIFAKVCLRHWPKALPLRAGKCIQLPDLCHETPFFHFPCQANPIHPFSSSCLCPLQEMRQFWGSATCNVHRNRKILAVSLDLKSNSSFSTSGLLRPQVHYLPRQKAMLLRPRIETHMNQRSSARSYIIPWFFIRSGLRVICG